MIGLGIGDFRVSFADPLARSFSFSKRTNEKASMFGFVSRWMSAPRLLLCFALFLAGLGAFEASKTEFRAPWRDTSREPTGLAPDPAEFCEAVVQVYAAKTYGWRGIFGVHTWIAYKGDGDPRYTVAEVARWTLARTGSAVSISHRAPDARWFGNMPALIGDVRGEAAREAIAHIEEAIAAYPHASRYVVWPGPNSNTFVATILAGTPQLRVDLPPTAIGKDYTERKLVGAASSGTGWRVGYGGLAGLTVAREEGVEANLLGLVFGIDVLRPALKLPFVGRVGVAKSPGAIVEAIAGPHPDLAAATEASLAPPAGCFEAQPEKAPTV